LILSFIKSSDKSGGTGFELD